jgi:hypothetical protein
MSAQPLPSLFGRFTAIFKDHDQLAKTLRRLRQMCAALDDGQARLPPDLAPDLLIIDLRNDLSEHFAAEETAEYFGTVVDEAPELASDIAALKWEHLTMLRGVDVLCGLARDRSRWQQLSGPTRELIGQLERHERSESRLLRSLFSGVA